MSNITLPLPDRLQQFAELQARAKGFAGAADYIVSLVAREERKRGDMEQLETALKEGLDSGAAIDVNDHYWERKRHQLLARHRGREGQLQQPTGGSTTAAATAARTTGGNP